MKCSKFLFLAEPRSFKHTSYQITLCWIVAIRANLSFEWGALFRLNINPSKFNLPAAARNIASTIRSNDEEGAFFIDTSIRRMTALNKFALET